MLDQLTTPGITFILGSMLASSIDPRRRRRRHRRRRQRMSVVW
jgi:hypothetical protein